MRQFISALAATMIACGHDTPTNTTPTPITSVAAELAVGNVAPDFDATAQDGTKIKLSALHGKPVVLYFYPKDETPGCTTEACSFRDSWDALKATGALLIGVSMDDDASHRAFVEHHKLPFLLVSDPHNDLGKLYGVPTKDIPNIGTIQMRQTFVIGADGKLLKIYRKVDVTKHADEIRSDLAVNK